MVNHKIAEGLRVLAVPIDSVKLDDKNARDHPDPSVSGLKASLDTFGQRKPIVVNKNTNKIEAGNGNWLAAKELGWTHIAALFVADTDDEARAFGLVDNRSAELSAWSPEEVTLAVQEINVSEAAIADMLVDLAQSLESMVAGADATQPPKEEDKPMIPEMELLPYEHYDYLIILSKNQADWNWLLDKFMLKREKSPLAKTKVGLGRAIWAGTAIKIITGELNGSAKPEDRRPEQGTPEDMGSAESALA